MADILNQHKPGRLTSPAQHAVSAACCCDLKLAKYRRLSVRKILILVMIALGLTAIEAVASEYQYDQEEALAISQAVIGSPLGHYSFVDSMGRSVDIDANLDKPLIISMIFTSCHHVCPAITHHLSIAVEKAREALGADSFQVLTIGFDVENDSPEAMRYFAEQQNVDDPNWTFLSADQNTIDLLVENIGFVYFPSPRGFDHINQLTLVGGDGQIYRQVYGAAFELPWLMEPLKELVYNKPANSGHMVASFIDRIKLFCTVYDPSSGRYRFDYSMFIQIAIGGIALLLVGGWLLVESRRSRLRKQCDNE